MQTLKLGHTDRPDGVSPSEWYSHLNDFQHVRVSAARVTETVYQLRLGGREGFHYCSPEELLDMILSMPVPPALPYPPSVSHVTLDDEIEKLLAGI